MPTYAKAIASMVSTFLAGLAVALTAPAATFGDLADGQWVALISASLAAALVVYGIRNGISGDPTTSTPERVPRDTGLGAVELVVVVILVLVAIWLLTTLI